MDKLEEKKKIKCVLDEYCNNEEIENINRVDVIKGVQEKTLWKQ